MINDQYRREYHYKIQRLETIAADERHNETMERIAARGGKTLEQLRKMSMRAKDAFITKYRDKD